MNLAHHIAKKIAFTSQKSFTQIIVKIAIVSIAISLAVMIISTAMITGFKKEITTKIFGFWGHIHITDTNVNRTFEPIPIDKNQEFYPSLDTISSVEYMNRTNSIGYESESSYFNHKTNGGINQIQPFAISAGIINTQKEFEGILLKGVDKGYNWNRMKEYLTQGDTIAYQDSTIADEIILSEQTAKRLKLEIEDKLVVHFIKGKDQVKRRFQLVGLYKTGLDEYDRKFALVDIRKVQDVLGWTENQVGGFEVFVDNIEDISILNEYIYLEVLPSNLFSETIRNKFPNIFEWLELQNINEVVILVLMILVSIINMITALLILILERTHMIGTLKALGSRNWTIRKIFLYHGAYIITMGLLFGNLLGVGFCLLQQKFELIKLNEANYYLSVAPIDLNLMVILLLNAGTLIITLAVLIIPTYLITRISPVRTIRFR
jgi:lipoprotein-releasing system permease protein